MPQKLNPAALVNGLVSPDDLRECAGMWFHLIAMSAGQRVSCIDPLRLITSEYMNAGLTLYFEKEPHGKILTLLWREIIEMKPLPIAKKKGR